MRHRLIPTLLLLLSAQAAVAQAPQAADNGSTPATDSVRAVERQMLFPRNLIGIRGGVNLSDMKYTYEGIDHYHHTLQLQGVGGIFGHFQLGKSHFAIRPEVALAGRADSLDWLDVRYRLKAHYLDFRLPITYNFRFRNSFFSPYLMVAPQFNMAYGGRVTYSDEVDYPNGASAPITEADISQYDASVMAGLGFDYLIRTKGAPILFSLEAGYNWGLLNTFAQRERLDNPNVAAADRSNIGNPFFGAELWQEERHNRGIEVALRLALPIDNSWKGEPKVLDQKITDTLPVAQVDTPRVDTVFVHTPVQHDTVYLPDTNRRRPPLNGEYERKDCYSFSEMYAFVTLGIDISDKRMCLFNVNFDFDSYRLRPESKAPLEDVAKMMQAFPEMRIKIIGHTDSCGSDSYNERLSANRAKEVARYISSKGVDMGRMETEGFGEKYPIDTNVTEEGRFNNRRVEIEVLNVKMQLTDPKRSEEN